MNFLTVLFLLSGMLFVSQKSDAQCSSFGIDFKQGANRDAGYDVGEIHWINSILQQNNSRYIEGMSTLQRIVFDNLPVCSGTHTLRIKMEARKGDVHAYDFLTSWDNAFKAAEAIAPGFGLMPSSRLDPDLHECGDEISSCAEAACTLVTGSVFRDLPIISNEFDSPTPKGETNLLITGPPADQNTTRQVIDAYECRYGDNITIASGVNAGEYDRSVRVYTTGFTGTTGDANNAVYFVGYGNSTPNDGGDTYIYYDIVWSSTSTSVVIEFAAHIAVGVDGLANSNPGGCNESPLGVGYLLNRGASSISGGPYHVIVEDFIGPDGTSGSACEPNLGNQDNQLQGSEILLIPSCNLQGPSAACANSTATYTATVTNPDNATNANNSTYLWQIINSSQSPPPASIIGSASGNVPQVPAGQTSVPLSITVNTGGIGSYTVKLTITNGAATTTTDDDVASSCTVSTTVTGGPTATCPAPSTAAACLTQAQVDAAYQAWLATATGMSNNGGTTGPDRCGGTKTVVFTATNTCGTATCSATFTVTADNTAPGFTGNYANVPLGCNPSDISGALNGATATDNCGATTITQSDGAVQSSSCTRTQTRTFTARDACGNTATISRTVTWTADVTPPVFTGSYANVPLGCNPAQSDINAALDGATATDGCGPVTISQSDGSVSSSSCGRSQTRTFTARDGCGNTSTVSRTVTWTADVTPPVFTGSYTTVNLGCNPVASDVTGALGTASATDACGPVTITQSDGTIGQTSCGNTQTRTFTARDACGNTATTSRTVNWGADATPPGFTGSYANVPLGCNPAASDINAALNGATATDGCGPVTISQSDGSVGSTGCSRSQTRTFVARDACGNTASVSRTVTWTADVTPPVFGNIVNVTLGCNPSGGDINTALGTASATDACGPVTISQSDGSVTSDGCLRSQTRTFTARDGCGNTATAARSVTWTADVTPPVFTGSYSTVNLGCNPVASDIAGALGSASATDACGPVTITQSDGTIGQTSCGNTQTRCFTARDACGNTATVCRTVNWGADATPPGFTGSYANVALGCNPSANDISTALDGATATDGCGPTTITQSDGPVGSTGCSRSQTRTFTARDACGNTATISRTVTWTADVTPPSITTGGTGTSLGCNPSAGDINNALGTATATDACGPTTISQSDGPVTSDGCSRSQTRTFTARDGCGNTATAARTVTWIADVTPPVITSGGGSLTLGCNPAASDINNSLGTATATDACGVPTVTQSDGPVVSTNCARSQTRTFTARDACGNTATAARTVTWTADLTPPAFTGSYTDVNLGCNPAASDISGALGSSSATDACGPVTISQSDGSVSSDGCSRSQTRTFTARDGCGNTASVSRTVRWIADLTPPVISGDFSDVSLGCNPANPDNSLGGASASDACGPVTISQSDGPVVSNGCNRSRTRSFTARDGCGNTSTAARTVRWVADVTPPVLTTGGGTLTLGCNPAASDINNALGTATASDACGVPTVTVTDGNVTSSSCGRSQTRTWIARDACGNTSTASRTATWTADVTAPVFTNCPASTTIACSATPVFGTPTASDACSTPTVTQLGTDVVQGTCPTTHTRRWVARDACGNTSTCSQTITVPCCAVICTYTQGAYGSEGGKMCDGTQSVNNPYSTLEMIEHNLLAYSGLLRIGCPGHSVTVATGQAQCVIDKLPGGGPSGPLPAGDFSICNLPGSMLKNGRINNALLAQTLTLGLNLGINPPTLGNFALQPNMWLVTADVEECGSTTIADCEFNCVPNPFIAGQYIWTVSSTPYHVSDCRISQAIYNALTTKNVAGLFAFANSILCGNALPAGVSYSDVTNAVDCINNAFDECRSFVGWVSGTRPTPESFCTLPSATTPCPPASSRMITGVTPDVDGASELTVTAYPNPFRDQVRFVINSQVSGQASLEVYNMLGQRIQTVYTGNIVAGRSQVVEYEAPGTINGGMIYILKQNGKQVTGKLLNIE